ncbi:MAG: hypothetical protein RLZZ352_1081 [Pseudomonadota bacterium]|jgi:aminoglycoside phosphotransferase (APT) family kinase protein
MSHPPASAEPSKLQHDTREVSPQHAVNTDALARWLSQHLPGFAGPLTVRLFKGGQSNPTYLLSTPAHTYVMRAKPGPVARLLPSAHAIEREFRVMQALHGTGVPVARMQVLCEDESVIGRAFYIMEYVAGRVFWDPALPELPREERSAVYDEMNRVMAALHRVQPQQVGLSDYGKPGNYFERQIGRWSKQYQASITQPIADMDRLMDWLPRNMPAMASDPAMVSVVHGDFRLDNLMFHPTEPRVLAVLDWELSTLGHPLADFSYHCMAWHITPGLFRGMAGLDLAALGIPAEADYIARYCERSGWASPAQLQADWPFYLAYNLFRLAAILQGIAKRVENGTASSAQALQSAAGARPLAELAWRMAQAA